MGEQVSLQELFLILKKRLLLILSITFAVTFLCAIVNYFYLTPIYQASTQLLVNQSRSDDPRFDYGEIQTNLELINTYSVIIKSPVILEKVKEDLNLFESVEELNSMINVSSENESQVVRVTVVNTEYRKAAEIANKVGEVFQSEIVNIMKIDNVSVLNKAEPNNFSAPISPHRTLNTAIAFVVGLMASIALAFLLEYFDNTINNEAKIMNQLKIPVLGTVSKISKNDLTDDNNLNSPSTNLAKQTFGS
jgi:capsular polysaccharide biosynthesis protein